MINNVQYSYNVHNSNGNFNIWIDYFIRMDSDNWTIQIKKLMKQNVGRS